MPTDRPTVTMRLEPLPGVDLDRALRAVLKTVLRRHGLRCIELRGSPVRFPESPLPDSPAEEKTHQ
jgi:hypothetical protein